MFDARHGSQLLQKMFQTVENIIHLIDKDDMSKYLLFLEDVWADEPELIEEKYQEIQELYPQISIALAKGILASINKQE